MRRGFSEEEEGGALPSSKTAREEKQPFGTGEDESDSRAKP